MHPMFGKLAIGWGDLAFGTDAAPATDRIQINPQLPGGRQHRGARRKVAAFARGGENHKRVGGHARSFKKRYAIWSKLSRAKQ